MTDEAKKPVYDLQALFNEAAAQQNCHQLPEFDMDANWMALYHINQGHYAEFLATLQHWQEQGFNAVEAEPFHGYAVHEWEDPHLEQFKRGQLKPVQLKP